MEGGCSVCGSPNTGYICGCTNPPTRLCLECRDTHLEEEKDHAMKKVKAKPLIGSETCAVCYLCKAAFASVFCCCGFPVFVLCGACKTLHVRKNSACVHPMFPVSEVKKVNSIEDVERVKIKVVHGHMAEERLRQNVLEVKKCEERIVQCTQELITVIEARRDELLKQLSDIQSEFLLSLESAVSEVQKHSLDEQFASENQLASWIQHFSPDDPMRSSLLFSYEIASTAAVQTIQNEFKANISFMNPGVNLDLEIPAECNQLLTTLKRLGTSIDSRSLLALVLNESLDHLSKTWKDSDKNRILRHLTDGLQGIEMMVLVSYFSTKAKEEQVLMQVTDEVFKSMQNISAAEMRDRLSTINAKKLLEDRVSSPSVFKSKDGPNRIISFLTERIRACEYQVSVTDQLEALCTTRQEENAELKETVKRLTNSLKLKEKECEVHQEEVKKAETSLEQMIVENATLREQLCEKETALLNSSEEIHLLQGRLKALEQMHNTASGKRENSELAKELSSTQVALKEITSKNEYLKKDIEIMKSKLNSASSTEAKLLEKSKELAQLSKVSQQQEAENEKLLRQLEALYQLSKVNQQLQQDNEKLLKELEDSASSAEAKLADKHKELAHLSKVSQQQEAENEKLLRQLEALSQLSKVNQQLQQDNGNLLKELETYQSQTSNDHTERSSQMESIYDIPGSFAYSQVMNPRNFFGRDSTAVLRFSSEGCLYEFDVASTQIFSRPLTSPMTTDEGTVYCYLTEDLFFGCGGYENGKRAFYIHLYSMEVVGLPNMFASRSSSGIVSIAQCAYVFGGRRSRATKNHKTCEKYSLNNDEWTRLPSMSTARSCFSPCRLNSKVYIIGGEARGVNISEVFDIASEQFTILTICFEKPLLTFPLGSKLLLIYHDCVQEWDLNKGRRPKQTLAIKPCLDEEKVIDSMCACIQDSVLAFLDPVMYNIITIDLKSGEAKMILV